MAFEGRVHLFEPSSKPQVCDSGYDESPI